MKALANPMRLAILTSISECEVSYGILTIRMGVTQSAISQHITKLNDAGLVTINRTETGKKYVRAKYTAITIQILDTTASDSEDCDIL